MAKFVGDHLRVRQVFLTSYTSLASSRNAYYGSRAVDALTFDSSEDARQHAELHRTNGTAWITHEFASITFASGESQLELRGATAWSSLFSEEFISSLPISSVESLLKHLKTHQPKADCRVHPGGTKLPARLPLTSYKSRHRKGSEVIDWVVFLPDGFENLRPIAMAIARLTDFLAHTAPQLRQ